MTLREMLTRLITRLRQRWCSHRVRIDSIQVFEAPVGCYFVLPMEAAHLGAGRHVRAPCARCGKTLYATHGLALDAELVR